MTEEVENQGYGCNNANGGLTLAKVKKLLITAGVYSTPTMEQIRKLRSDGNTVEYEHARG